MLILGIDPGLSGALAFLDPEKNVCAIFDMPTHALTRNGKNKREIDIDELARLVRTSAPIHHAFIEQVSAMPGQGVSSVFAFGQAFMAAKMAVASAQVARSFVSPVKWKNALAVPAAKDGARARASQLLPHLSGHWSRVKDDGRAEAALIALYGAQQFGMRAVA